MKYLVFVLLSLLCIPAFAKVDTVQVFSTSMKQHVKAVVITPAGYQQSTGRFPVLYLLHGYAGNYSNWIKRVPELDSLASVYKMIIVCPDAAFGSWYFDSPVDSNYRYETFTAKELTHYIDQRYRTISHRNGRAITGLSMGGHGAMFLAMRHPQLFGACGSMSGALDVSRIKRGFGVSDRLGDTIANLRYYKEWSVMHLLDNYAATDSLSFIIDCGLDDFIFGMSAAAHQKMVKLRIPHDYIERPGAHDWRYWSVAIRYQLLYFREWFNRNK